MSLLRRLLPQSIVGQITSLVVATTLLGVGLTMIVFVAHLERESRANPELVAATQAARIATIVKQAETDSSPKLAEMMRAAQWYGIHAEIIQTSQLAPAPNADRAASGFLQSISTILKETWGITSLTDMRYPRAKDALILRISNDSALVLQNASPRMLIELAFVPVLYAVVSIVLLLLFFAIYGVRWIILPLSSVVRAARSFGRSPTEDLALSEAGPIEIAQVVAVLNDTAKRIRVLMDERTRMLAAISHDLRTPLTRMRLRAERIGDVKTRDGMLDDIAIISDMLNGTLAYLRDGGRAEPTHLVDLSSLLQTICARFSDVGHSVSYEGPARFAFACRAQALTRAVTNIVENGVKNGSTVAVALRVLGDDAVQIEVLDDGPGIPVELQDKVFDPFFKGDSARPSSRLGGFGLGLSIARDVIRNHGGEIVLSNRVPTGLSVRMDLKSTSPEHAPQNKARRTRDVETTLNNSQNT